MAIFELPTAGCRGLDMKDGARYEARPNGTIEVNNPEHVRLLDHESGLRRWNAWIFPSAPEAVCRGCGFRQFAAFARRPCPHCGGEFDACET